MTDAPGSDRSDRSDRSDTSESHDPKELGDLDPSQFVGDAPVGDASPGDFISNNVSRQGPGSGDSTDAPDQTDTQEDA